MPFFNPKWYQKHRLPDRAGLVLPWWPHTAKQSQCALMQALLQQETPELLVLLRKVFVSVMNASAITPPGVGPLAAAAWQLIGSFLDAVRPLARSPAVLYLLSAPALASLSF